MSLHAFHALLAQLSIPLIGGRRVVVTAGPQSWPWLGVGLLAAILLLWLYRIERQLVSRNTGLALLTLRAAAALALVFALLDPIGQRTFDQKLRSRVICGIDLSSSMDVSDPTRSAPERDALAKTLNRPADESVSKLVRAEIAAGLLQSGWLDDLERKFDVEAVGFARIGITHAKARSLANELRNSHLLDQPDRLATDWSPVFDHALENSRDQPTQAVILLTDGRQNAQAAATRGGYGERLRARKVPVYTVLIGSTQPARDAAVAAIQVPDRVMKGDSADVIATLKLEGEVPGATGAVAVRLEREGKTLQEKTVSAPLDGTRPQVAFRVPMEELGFETFTVAVGPFEGDRRLDNDRRSATIEVVDEKTRVLLIDREARWEFRYLHNLLTRDTQVTLSAVVLIQQAAEAAQASYATELPQAVDGQPDPINAFDLVILGDVAKSDLSQENWDRLQRFVDNRGGTLVWSAGRHLPELLAQNPLARKLLPVTDPRVLEPDPQSAGSEALQALPTGRRIVPSSFALDHPWPMLRLVADEAENRSTWDALPTQPWLMGGRAKQSALVLARASESSGESAPLDTLVAMPYGLGRVLWIGTDGTWRWRFRADDSYHRQFWGQVVRWANSSRLTAGNALVRFGSSRRHFDNSAAVLLRARFSESAPDLGPDALVAARLFRAKTADSASFANLQDLEATSEPVAVIALRHSPRQPRLYEAEVPTLSPGLYLMRLEVPQLDNAPNDLALFDIAPSEGSERVELSASREEVDELAAATGGLVVNDYEAGRILQTLQPSEIHRTQVETTTLWDRPAALVFFLSLLAVEWFLRKRAGLP